MKPRGFSMVELPVVIVILGLLAARADQAKLAVLGSGPDPADPKRHFEGSN